MRRRRVVKFLIFSTHGRIEDRRNRLLACVEQLLCVIASALTDKHLLSDHVRVQLRRVANGGRLYEWLEQFAMDFEERFIHDLLGERVNDAEAVLGGDHFGKLVTRRLLDNSWWRLLNFLLPWWHI